MRAKKSPLQRAGAVAVAGPDPAVHPAEGTIQELYLHIAWDGREVHFDREPLKSERTPTLFVEILGLADGTCVEQTYTLNIENWVSARLELYPVRPRGEGWKMFDATADKFTAWRRPHIENVS